MEKKRSAAFYLHHSYWSWRVPEYMLVTEYASKTHGLVLPDNPAKANALLQNRAPVTATAARMAELFYENQGMPLDISDPLDGRKLYEYIMEHMADWVSYCSRPQLIQKPIPIQGMREFNLLAKKLFNVAHRYGYYEKPVETFASSLQSLLSGCTTNGIVRVTHAFNDRLIAQLEMLHRAQTRTRASLVRSR